jgi:uncharacterized membrane protein
MMMVIPKSRRSELSHPINWVFMISMALFGNGAVIGMLTTPAILSLIRKVPKRELIKSEEVQVLTLIHGIKERQVEFLLSQSLNNQGLD